MIKYTACAPHAPSFFYCFSSADKAHLKYIRIMIKCSFFCRISDGVLCIDEESMNINAKVGEVHARSAVRRELLRLWAFGHLFPSYRCVCRVHKRRRRRHTHVIYLFTYVCVCICSLAHAKSGTLLYILRGRKCS